ncbi:MAG TPA: MFS transporter [Candidatus Dormibacteraeota bacterium]|nr:MFS transporter [Candidatus Dormibacteraeota bacterium]
MTVRAQRAGAAPAVPGRRLGLGRIIVLSLYWVALGYLWLPLGSQVIPQVILDLGLGAHKGTLVLILEGGGTLLSIFVQPIVGALSDRTNSRFGRRHPYILLGTLGSCLFLALMILAGSFFWLMGLYFLLQLSENCAQGPYQGLLPDVVPDEDRSRASAFVGGGNLLGLLLGTLVVGTFMASNRKDLAIISMIVVLLAAAVVIVTTMPDRVKPAGDLQLNLKELFIGTFAISPRKYSNFLWLMTSRLFILVAIAGLQSFALFFFRDVFYPGRGVALDDAAQAATRDLSGVIILLALAVSYPAAAISHRLGRKPLIIFSGLVGAAGAVGLILSPYVFLPAVMLAPLGSLLHLSANLSQALYCGMLVGIAAGSFLSVDWAYLVEVIPMNEAGRFLGFSNLATAGAGVLARLVGGPLIDIFNARGHILGQPGGYPVTFSVYVAFFLLGTLAILKVGETRPRRRIVPSPVGP